MKNSIIFVSLSATLCLMPGGALLAAGTSGSLEKKFMKFVDKVQRDCPPGEYYGTIEGSGFTSRWGCIKKPTPATVGKPMPTY